MLLLTTLIWGATFALTKALLATLQPMGLLTWRFGIAVVVFHAVFGRKLRGIFNRTTLLHGALLGFLLYLGFGLQTLGLQFTSSGRSGFITVLYVAITPLLQILVLKRLPALRVGIGIFVVLLGLWSLTSPAGPLSSLADASGFEDFGTGDLLTLGCALTFAGYMLILDRVSQNAEIIHLTAVQLITVFICSLTHSLLTEPWTMPGTIVDWSQMLFLAIFATVMTTYWQTRYQRYTTPTRAAVIFTMESVFAAIIGTIFLGENFGATGVLGGVLIVAGLLIVELKRESK